MVAWVVEVGARRRVAGRVYYEVWAIEEGRVSDGEVGCGADEESEYEEAC